MTAQRNSITTLDRWGERIARRGQLVRGQRASWRGAQVGARFGLGRRVVLLYPSFFRAGDDVTIEDDAFLHCLSERGVRIGSNTSIARGLWLHCGGTPMDHGHGFVEIGERSFVGCNAVLGAGGGITIGSNVLIGQSVNMHAEQHIFDDPNRLIREQGVSSRGILVEDDVWIGSRAVVLDGVAIGRGAVVAAGAVVTHSVPALSVVAGVPARVIRRREFKS